MKITIIFQVLVNFLSTPHSELFQKFYGRIKTFAFLIKRGYVKNVKNKLNFVYLFLFYLYIYPPDLQESDGGVNTEGKQLPQPALGDAKILPSACKFNRDMTLI